MRLNRPSWRVIEGDINDVSSAEMLKKGRPETGRGGHPDRRAACQPFSKSSYWVSGDALRLDDPRADTLTGYLRVLRDTRPRAFLLENVPGSPTRARTRGFGTCSTGSRRSTRRPAPTITCHGKSSTPPLTGFPRSASACSDRLARRAQVRLSRGHARSTARKGFRAPSLTGRRGTPSATCRSPRTSFLKIGGKWGDLLPSIPEGPEYLWHTDRRGGKPLFGWRTRYWSFLLKLSKRLPSWTIQAQPGSAMGPFHWNNRRLTVQGDVPPSDVSRWAEARVRPDGHASDAWQRRAFARRGGAGREIRRQLLNAPTSGPLRLLPPRRKRSSSTGQGNQRSEEIPCPCREHEAHPGTGKGRQALRRAELLEAES